VPAEYNWLQTPSQLAFTTHQPPPGQATWPRNRSSDEASLVGMEEGSYTSPVLVRRKFLSPRLLIGLLVSMVLSTGPCWGQQNGAPADQREVLEQILTQTYYPSIVGKHAMGIGSATEVRRAGIVVVVQRPGLAASIDRTQLASTEVHGLESSLYRGHKDYDVPVGERFYVFSVSVGLETVTFGLLTARGIAVGKGNTRLWAAVSFYLPKDVIANAEKDVAFHAIDAWFVPEGRSAAAGTTGTPSAPAPAPGYAPAMPAPVPAGPPADLTPGMTREQVVAAMGAPQHEVNFQGKTLLSYPGMVVVLEGGKLASIDQSGQPSINSKVAIQSDPGAADIFMDGQMVGQTPSTLDVPPGDHQINVRLAGYQDWTRRVHVLPGSTINLSAKLEKK
jgi:hypothetical protein